MNKIDIKKEEIVTGDNIQAIADYEFNIKNYNKVNNCNHSKDKVIDIQINEVNKQKPDIIFVYGHDIPNILPHIERIDKPFKLITHNSDLGIFDEHKKFISDKIIEWYGQNNYTDHEKTFGLPIGVARARWPHGNLDLLTSVANLNSEKTNLVYKNFAIGTNANVRQQVHNITQGNGINMSPKVSIKDYWINMSKSVFTISPPGNGVDCHRIWEALYLNTFPVVQNHITFKDFKDLPIIFIDDWNKVTIGFLHEKINFLKKYDNPEALKKLTISYWKDKIRG